MITLFNKSVNGQFFLKLDMDEIFDQATIRRLAQFNMSSVVISESMLSSTPYMNIKFFDFNGSLFNTTPLLPNNKFHITYGVNAEDSKTSSFKYSLFKTEPSSDFSQENFYVNSDMIMSEWKKMFVDTHSRSWKNSRYSDVVSDVVSTMNFDNVVVEQTKKIQNVIQPNCSNAVFLKWLTKNSLTDLSVGGFVYYITLDNEFYYRSIEDIIKNVESKKIVANGFTDDNTGFITNKIVNDYFTINSTGGLGTSYTYFDYSKKQFITNDVTVENIKQHQLSDTSIYHVDDIEPTYNYFGGRDINTGDVVQTNLTNIINSSLKTELTLKGNNTYKVGDKIELILPVSDNMKQLSQTVTNDLYSGYWIVWKVAHVFDIKTDKYYTKLFMFKDGINNIPTPYLLTTESGKFVG